LALTSSSKDVLISKDLSDEIIFLKRTYCVSFKLYCKPKKLLHEILELELTGVFSNIAIALYIFVGLPSLVASGECTFSMLT
jgi:hypothetical protein